MIAVGARWLCSFLRSCGRGRGGHCLAANTSRISMIIVYVAKPSGIRANAPSAGYSGIRLPLMVCPGEATFTVAKSCSSNVELIISTSSTMEHCDCVLSTQRKVAYGWIGAYEDHSM